MHPALSVIVFTTLSGIGFGLMALLGLNLGAPEPAFQWGATIAAFACAVAGLLSSTLHLRSPSRAILAFSQWRSSWLSREGVASVLTLGVFGLYSIAALFYGARPPALGIAAALLAMATVFTTSMIYAQLRTVAHWATWLTSAAFLCFSIAGAALALAALMAVYGAADVRSHVLWAIVALAVAWGVKFAWWHRAAGTAREAAGSGIGEATGLGGLGTVRPFEPPHTSPNYVMREMVFVIGRRRACALRRLAVVAGGAAPVLLAALAAIVASPVATAALLVIALVSHVGGMLAERWLFFAEAEHAVGAFYGRPAAA